MTSREGWLFLWNFDRIKYFGDAVEEVAAKPRRNAKNRCSNRTSLAIRLGTNRALSPILCGAIFRGIKRNRVVYELQQRLAEEGVKVPGDHGVAGSGQAGICLRPSGTRKSRVVSGKSDNAVL